MINTLYLPELREMLVEKNQVSLQEFCTALHPARTAEFMEGLSPEEVWAVLQYTDLSVRTEIFSFFELPFQVDIIESHSPEQVAEVVADMSADDRVDLLADIDDDLSDQILALLPTEERRDVLRLSEHAEGTAGAIMTTEMARLPEELTVREALDEISRQAEELETIYYLYVVDENDNLHGVVSTRQLITALVKNELRLQDIMETEIIHVNVMDDQEDVLRKMADYDLIAIPVVDEELRLVGIITHDDILDVVVEEAAEDAYRSAAVEPLEETYMQTPLLILSWKRGVWLIVLFLGAIFTAFALRHYEAELLTHAWLVLFIPLVISTGGNSGNQSATLVITALNKEEVSVDQWVRVLQRELVMGLVLGGGLAILGFLIALFIAPDIVSACIIPITILLVVISGTLIGSTLPLIFEKIGLDPALMSNPFVAGIIDFLGIVIYMTVALLLLRN
ncbi:MAG: magnesium transporter [Pirellulales bacterium]